MLDSKKGGIFGLLAAVIALLCDIIAISMTPNYSIFRNMVSDLGVGPGALFFNLGLIISGIVAIPFYLSLGQAVQNDGNHEGTRKAAVNTAIFSCITYSLVGVFPAIPDDRVIIVMHGTVAFLSISSAVIYCLLFSGLMLNHFNFSRYQAYLGFFAASLYMLFLCTWQPITEWIMAFALTPWIIINSSYLILKEELQSNE